MAPAKAPNNRRRTSRPGAGDMTGRVKAQNAREQKQAADERADEISMQNQANAEEELNGVYDPQSGLRLDDAEVQIVDAEDDGSDDDEESEFDETPGFPQFPRSMRQTDQEPAFSGQEDPETIAPILAARRTFTPPTTEVTRNSTVKVRVEQDIEKMTYGMRNGEPNNYDFREGVLYVIPWGVYEHLNERGLIRQMIG